MQCVRYGQHFSFKHSIHELTLSTECEEKSFSIMSKMPVLKLAC